MRRPRAPRRDEAYFERVREALDEAMLQNPAVAHLARANPLSKKYRGGLLRAVPSTPKRGHGT